MAGIKDAIVEILTENSESSAWATGGIFARRAPGLAQPPTAANRRLDKYLVVRVTDSDPNESHVQDAPATVTTDRVEVSIWASSSRDADAGANAVRHALDGWYGESAGISFLHRIFWRGTDDREVEDASSAEQLMDCCVAEFDVAYRLP